ncbi:Peptidyl-prolyl cis-trans isomerase fkbp12, partial [Perkinsus olseni]
ETGKKFWSTKDAGQKPFTYQSGVGQVITGWDQGVLGMHLGEVKQLVIPANEGYGAGGFPAWGIPPNGTLNFEIEVLNIQMASEPPPLSPRLPEVVKVDVVDSAVAKGDIRTAKKLKNWLGDRKGKHENDDEVEKRHLFGKKKARKGDRPVEDALPRTDEPKSEQPTTGQWEVDTRENFKARLNAASPPPDVGGKRLWLTHIHHYHNTFDGLEPGDRDFHRLTAVLGPKKSVPVFEENGPCGAVTLNAFSLKGVPRGILGGVRPYLMLHMACSGGKKRRAGRTARLMRYKKSVEEYICNESFVLHVYHPVTVLRLRVMLRRSALNMLGDDEVLGEVLFPIRKAVPGKTVEGWFHLEPSEDYDGLYCGRIRLSIRVDYLSKIDQICANFATPPEKLRHLPKYNPANVYTSVMRIKELLWDKSLRDVFFDFKKVGSWDPTHLRVSVIPMVSWLALCRWLPGDRLFGMIALLLVGILAKTYHRTKAKGRLGCLAGDKGDRDQAAMVQALSESLPTIVPEKKKISTSRRKDHQLMPEFTWSALGALDDLYALPGFTKPAALKDRKKQKNILKQNRKHRNLATGA